MSMRSLAVATLAGLIALAPAARADVTLLNVSYDPTRELYKAINAACAPLRGLGLAEARGLGLATRVY